MRRGNGYPCFQELTAAGGLGLDHRPVPNGAGGCGPGQPGTACARRPLNAAPAESLTKPRYDWWSIPRSATARLDAEWRVSISSTIGAYVPSASDARSCLIIDLVAVLCELPNAARERIALLPPGLDGRRLP